MLPVFHYNSGETMLVIQGFPNGDKLTKFIKLYLVSYVLGMIARYWLGYTNWSTVRVSLERLMLMLSG